ncbi:ankyrin repeat and SOCS box protein 15 isoform X1 [Brienomyrus brachyistius]|uniref:ankyrin repeat and SOCS box protein 15 isoform X1 n=1 Tax=Brienomyrus brachyistius TaxID=42636 RepID=UPI0020B31A85|nr:ankyrin repeat and SOCS box protein 15 isoform X1 [Brienomyrus brachyistius]
MQFMQEHHCPDCVLNYNCSSNEIRSRLKITTELCPVLTPYSKRCPGERPCDTRCRVMDADEDVDNQLMDYVIQMSVQDCNRHLLSSLESLELSSHEYLKILAAIEHGDLLSLERLSKCTAAFREVDNVGWLPLHKAAVQPRLEVLEMVLFASYELTLEEKTAEGDTAVTLAVQAGRVENVRFLLKQGASPNNANSRNETPLLLAVRTRSYEMVSALVMAGAFVEQTCLKNWTAVHEAAKVGCSSIMLLLLRNGGRVTERDRHGVTPLGIAAEYAKVEVLEVLIKNGGDVNAQAANGDSVLYDAAGSGNPDCIDLLLQNGANPNVASLCGHLPIHRAAYEGHYTALKKFIPITTKRAIRLSGQSPVHSAADGGHPQCLQLLIGHGFNVNVLLEKHISENYGDLRRTPLYYAVSNGDVTCTEILLNAGANPDSDPLRCLLVAVRAGRSEIVRLLLASQADVNCYFTVVSDTVFPTALQYCLRDEMMMRLLLNNGYDAYRCFCCNHDCSWESCLPWQDDQPCDIPHLREKIPFCDFISSAWLKDVAGKVVRILVDYVSHVTLCSKLKLILEKQREWPEICDILGNPRPLTHLCRLVIRRQVTLRRLCHLDSSNDVPFPPRVTDYLLYKEHDLYSRIIGQKE